MPIVYQVQVPGTCVRIEYTSRRALDAYRAMFKNISDKKLQVTELEVDLDTYIELIESEIQHDVLAMVATERLIRKFNL